MIEMNATSFSSDDVAAMLGRDGTEPKEIYRWIGANAEKFPWRIVISLNQYYPEFLSGYYLNRSLIALIQSVLLSLGLSVVHEDSYRESGLVPIELPGTLDANDYVLADNAMAAMGLLKGWDSLGGVNSFYHDRFIIDILTSESLAFQIAEALKTECNRRRIRFTLTRSHR